MKKFTAEEVKNLLNQVYHEEISFSRMVGVLNALVSEAEEPIFENGDFLRISDGIYFIFKWFDLLDFSEEPVAFGHFFTGANGYKTLYNNPFGVCPKSAIDGFCTPGEKEKVLSDLASMGKRWNEDKKCVEDIPKRKFKVGDKVRIKDGISSKTHESIRPFFLNSMDKLIGKELTVKYCSNGGVVMCDGYLFSEEWLEPYDELKEGDLAIFWDNEKEFAIIKPYGRPDGGEEDYFQHKDQNGFRWRNAIKFESKEQFNRFIKGEI